MNEQELKAAFFEHQFGEKPALPDVAQAATEYNPMSWEYFQAGARAALSQPSQQPAAGEARLSDEQICLIADRLWEQGHISSLSRDTAVIFARSILALHSAPVATDATKLINIALGLMDSDKGASIVSEVANLLAKVDHMRAKVDDYDRLAEVARERQRKLDALAAPVATLPAGWVPLNITHEGQHPEEVAYGPQIMMDRLKKWLDRYFAMRAAPVATDAQEAGCTACVTCGQPWPDSAKGEPLTDEQIIAIVEAAPALDTAEAEWIYVVRAALALAAPQKEQP